MKTRKLARRASSELLRRYLAELPRISDPRQFRIVFARARATAAILGTDISGELARLTIERA